MSEIKPFRGIRFKSSDLSRLICPPYDIINEEGRKRLLALSKNNFVRIESPRKIYGTEKDDKRTAAIAAKTFKSWLKSGILVRDKKPAFYLYTQEFGIKGKKLRRTGFFAALRLEKNEVFGHEKIVQKPVIERLELMRRTGGMNISPIFCLFPDKKREIKRIVDIMAIAGNAELYRRFEDEDGIKHTISAVTNERIVLKLAAKLKKSRILIADGHHRYHTALMFREEMAAKQSSEIAVPRSGAAADKMRESYNYVLAYLCPLNDPNVVIMSTHRVVKPAPGIEMKLNRLFKLSGWNGKKPPYMIVYHNGSFYDMKFRNKDIEKKMSAYSKIPSLILSKTVLNETMPEDIIYTHDFQEAVQEAQKINGYAFLIESPSLETIYKFSIAGEIMPPKTTYFYPKVPAGLIIYGD